MPQPTALILDDDGTFARAAGQLAFSAGFRVQLVETLAEARTFLARTRADLVLLDLQLPDGSGMDLLDDVDLADHGQVVIVTGRPSLESATRAVSTPVIEYLVKPLDPAQLRRVMERVAARWRPAGPPPVDLSAVSGIVGNAPQVRAVVDSMLRTGPTDASVLVWGEPGTGKALVASALHAASGRSGPLVTLDCSALAPVDLATALFGADARPGAPAARGSAFARAQGGTLFLDAVDRMPLDLQARLAEALDIPGPGRDTGSGSAPAPIRLIAASDRDPQDAMRDRALRPDLYYALAQVSLGLPSLRERGEDVVVLVGHFIERLNLHYGREKRLAPGSEAALLRHSWPGNVRELRSAVQRAYLLEDGDDLHVRPQLPSEPVWKESDTSILFSVGTPLAEIERRALLKTLAHFDNDKTATARALGVSVRTVHNQLARLGIRRVGTDGSTE